MMGDLTSDSASDNDECDLLKMVEEHGVAPRFNSIRLLDPSEAGLSRVLKDLLDPNGSHGEGFKFLKTFIECFNIQLSGMQIDSNYSFEATTEYEIEGKRRIDIVVHSDEFFLAIENKPWAGDQPNQVKAYLDHLRSKNIQTTSVLIYLSRDGSGPSDHSIPEEECNLARAQKQLLVIPYTDLLDWLVKCREHCSIANVRNFIDEFIVYVDFQFAVYDKKIYERFEQQRYFKAALKIGVEVQGKKFEGGQVVAGEKIAGAFAFFRANRLKKLRAQVDCIFTQKNRQSRVRMDFDASFKFGQRIEIPIPDAPKYVFSFAFKDRGISKELHWGIEYFERRNPPQALGEIAKCVTEALNKAGSTVIERQWISGDTTWLCYQKFGEHVWDTVEPWQSILEDDGIALDMVTKIEELHKLFKEKELLERLK